MKRILFLLITLILSELFSLGQSPYRFKADIVMKERKIDSSFQYNKGKVFFDKNFNQVIYKMSFPQKEIFVSIDTLLYRFVDNKQVSVVGNPLKPEYSIYYFLLNNDISDFGLKKSNFKAASIEKVEDLILSKWISPQGSSSLLGKILITTKNKRLNSVLIYNLKGDLLNRQIYKNYQNVNGVEIPREILSVTYFGEFKKYQIIEFQNVLINEPGNDIDYNLNNSLKKQ